MVIASRFLGNLLDGPGQCGPQGFVEHGPTGFADGRQPTESPILRMALLELAREQAVRPASPGTCAVSGPGRCEADSLPCQALVCHPDGRSPCPSSDVDKGP